MGNESDIEQIELAIEEQNQRYASRGGSVSFAGIDGGIVKIVPDGFCWR